MIELCEYGKNITIGVENYIKCSIVNLPCSFQRYCATEERVINTEGAKNCKARTKKINVEDSTVRAEMSQDALDVALEDEKNNTVVTKKEKGTVTLVTSTYVVYDCNGKSCYKNGHFNVKIGDKIEI